MSIKSKKVRSKKLLRRKPKQKPQSRASQERESAMDAATKHQAKPATNALLGDARLSRDVRQAIASQIGREGGNRSLQKAIVSNGTQMGQLQRQTSETDVVNKKEEGITWSGFLQQLENAILNSPAALAEQCQSYREEIAPITSRMSESDPFTDQVSEVYTGLWGLEWELRKGETETTSADQKNRFNALLQRWGTLKTRMENARRAAILSDLAQARQETEALQNQLVLTYRTVYENGGDDETQIAISEAGEETTTLREISGHILSILNAINDAEMSGRTVAPLVNVLNRTMLFTNLILGWNTSPELASEARQGLTKLQNAYSIASTGVSLLGAGQFFPFFSHIPMLLGAIARQWGVIEKGMREQNSDWWELREYFSSEINCAVEPGGCAMWHYMLNIFNASDLSGVDAPSDEVVDYFDDHKDMFSRVATKLLDTSDVPTESWLVFWQTIDANRLNTWVFDNREWIWRLLYGERSFPDERDSGSD